MSPVIAVNHPPANNDVTLERLEDQIRWYDKKSASCQRWFKWLKAITMISGVFVPVFAVSAKGKNLAALLGQIWCFHVHRAIWTLTKNIIQLHSI